MNLTRRQLLVGSSAIVAVAAVVPVALAGELIEFVAGTSEEGLAAYWYSGQLMRSTTIPIAIKMGPLGPDPEDQERARAWARKHTALQNRVPEEYVRWYGDGEPPERIFDPDHYRTQHLQVWPKPVIDEKQNTRWVTRGEMVQRYGPPDDRSTFQEWSQAQGG